jgi:hypothetical protein
VKSNKCESKNTVNTVIQDTEWFVNLLHDATHLLMPLKQFDVADYFKILGVEYYRVASMTLDIEV